MWVIEVTCLKCREIKRTNRHTRCTSECSMRRHVDFCPPCQKSMAAEFDKQLSRFVYIRVEDEDGA